MAVVIWGVSSIVPRDAEAAAEELTWIECEINLRKSDRAEKWKDVTRVYAVNPTPETLYFYSANDRTLKVRDEAQFSDDTIHIHSRFRVGIETIITRATIDRRTLQYSGTSSSTIGRTDVIESGQCAKTEPKPVQESRP